MSITLGVDTGISGAVAVLSDVGDLLEVHDMPTLQDGPAGRRAVNAPLLASVIFKNHADRAFVGSVNARPGEGPTGAFCLWPRQLQPMLWKKSHALPFSRVDYGVYVESGRQRNRDQLAGGGFGSELTSKNGSVEQCFDLPPNRIDGVCVWA
jgi:hypothetical protein